MIYFDNSATTFPKPDNVYKNMIEFYKNYGANPGRGSYKIAIKANKLVEDTRIKLASLFNCENSNNVIFTLNATDSFNIIFNGILKENDEVITTVLEHNAVLRPLNHLKINRNIKIKFLEPIDEIIDLNIIKNFISKKTKIFCISHVSNVTGWIQNIEEIGNFIKNNSSAIFIVDASQSAGLLNIDIKRMKIDILVFTGHKALYGPTGIGGFIFGNNINMDYSRVGGSSINSESELHPDILPYKYEAGTLNLLGIAGLNEGLNFIMKNGINNILKKEIELKKYLIERLSDLKSIKIYTSKSFDNGIGIVSFKHNNLSPMEVEYYLDSKENICVRSGLHCAPLIHKFLKTYPEGTVRISLGYFNTREEIDILYNALKEID